MLNVSALRVNTVVAYAMEAAAALAVQPARVPLNPRAALEMSLKELLTALALVLWNAALLQLFFAGTLVASLANVVMRPVCDLTVHLQAATGLALRRAVATLGAFADGKRRRIHDAAGVVGAWAVQCSEWMAAPLHHAAEWCTCRKAGRVALAVRVGPLQVARGLRRTQHARQNGANTQPATRRMRFGISTFIAVIFMVSASLVAIAIIIAVHDRGRSASDEISVDGNRSEARDVFRAASTAFAAEDMLGALGLYKRAADMECPWAAFNYAQMLNDLCGSLVKTAAKQEGVDVSSAHVTDLQQSLIMRMSPDNHHALVWEAMKGVLPADAVFADAARAAAASAMHYFFIAADSSDPSDPDYDNGQAEYNLGAVYQSGMLVPRDLRLARRWFKRAALSAQEEVAVAARRTLASMPYLTLRDPMPNILHPLLTGTDGDAGLRRRRIAFGREVE